MVDDPIALCIGELAEPLAEHVNGKPHHPVGEHDAVVGLGCIGGGTYRVPVSISATSTVGPPAAL